MKTAVVLSKHGLSSMLVKAAHKDVLGLKMHLIKGEWVAYSTEKDGVKLQACHFHNLQIRDFISHMLNVHSRTSASDQRPW